MKSGDITFAAVLIAILLNTGCSEEAQQAAPHLIVRGMAKLSGAKKGFLVTDGQPTYHDWNAGTGNIAVPLKDAEASSFKAFEQPKNARILYARDQNRVYAADHYRPREIMGADAKSFTLVSLDGVYAKDDFHVYFLGVPIVDADPLTFEPLTYPFSQDEQNVFIGATPILGVDRESWRPLRQGWTGDYWYRSDRDIHPKKQELVFVAGWSSDAAAFYYGREAIAGVDLPTFEVVGDYYAKDKDRVFSRHFNKLIVIEGADPSTFVVHETADNALKRGPGADAHDAKAEYRDGKLFEAK